MVKILERLEPEIFQLRAVTSDYVELLKTENPGGRYL
jgi:hypothetical protein